MKTTMLSLDSWEVRRAKIRRDGEKLHARLEKRALKERMSTLGYDVARLSCKTLEQQKREII